MKGNGGIRILALVTDAYGGTGGIAQYNRDFLESLAAHPSVSEIVVVPRVIARDLQAVPSKVTHLSAAAGSKARFLRFAARLSGRKHAFDLVVCAHINLLPVAWLAARRMGARLLVMTYGLEVWTPGSWLQRSMLRRTDALVAISAITIQRLREWASIAGDSTFTIPNAIDLDLFTPGERSEDLRRRLGLGEGPVLLTLGRMDASEQAKGFDEVLEVLPALLEDYPTLMYCAAGDGTDRTRLEEKATKLGVTEHVIFTGYLPEEQKIDLYRLTDLYVMPSRLEGFGYVFLEALACGVPVVASSIDGSREAVRGGAWGWLADPNDRDEVLAAIHKGLRSPLMPSRDELLYFSKDRFRDRVWNAFETTLGVAARRS